MRATRSASWTKSSRNSCQVSGVILEDRHGRGSTIVTSQLPVEHWHDAIGDPTLSDAILDRLVHNAHRLPLAGESMRKRTAAMKPLDPTG